MRKNKEGRLESEGVYGSMDLGVGRDWVVALRHRRAQIMGVGMSPQMMWGGASLVPRKGVPDVS